MKDIGKKIARGAVWMVLFKFLDRSVGLVSTIVLARILAPADFGLVALATALIAAIELLGAFSFDVALINKPHAGREHFDTAWTLNVLSGLCAAALVALLAGPAATFYNEPRLAPVIWVLAASLAVQGFENIGVVVFRKELTFRKDFAFLLTKRLVAFSITMALAFWLRNYWALVIGSLTGKVTGIMISYVVHPYRPRPTTSAWREMVHFSKWLLANNLIFFFNSRVSDFIIGKLAGTHTLGLFSVSYEVSNMPTTEIVAPINRAVFPGYAKISADIDALRHSFLQVIAMVATFAIPAAVGIAAIADLLVAVVLGAKWIDAVPLIEILALYGGLHASQTNIGSVLLARGRPYLITGLAGTHLVILVALLALLVPEHRALGAAWAVLLALVSISPLNWWALVRTLDLDLVRSLSVFVRPVVSALMMSLCVHELKTMLNLPITASLLTCVLAGSGAYAVCLWGLWVISGKPHGPERELLRIAHSRLHGLFRLPHNREP